jgi:hypothetical protein
MKKLKEKWNDIINSDKFFNITYKIFWGAIYTFFIAGFLFLFACLFLLITGIGKVHYGIPVRIIK